MPTLYLDRQGLELSLETGRLHIKAPGGDAQYVPLTLIDRVVVLARCSIDSRILTALASRGAVLSVISPRDPAIVATAGAAGGPSAARRIAQYQAFYQPAMRLAIARAILGHKLRTQASLLRKAAESRVDVRHDLLKAVSQIEETRVSLATAGWESLLGHEGSAAAAYFRAYSTLFAPALDFASRNRRPPADPVNVCLSLSYTLLHVEAVRAISQASLDPYIGFLHDLHHGRESLACDLVELERARADEWTWCTFRDRILRPEHFSRGANRCVLGKAGRRAFYGAFQPLAEAAANRLRHWAYAIVRYFKADASEDLLAKSVPVSNIAGPFEA